MASRISTRPVEPKPVREEPKARKRLPQVSAKRKQHRASPEGQAGLAYMAKVRALPCIICREFGMVQTTKTEAHHWIMDRGGALKTSDFETIPLCKCHHQGTPGSDKVAVHHQPALWRVNYGPDHAYSARVRDMIEGDAEI